MVFRLLEGKSINLRIAEKEDIPSLLQWLNDVRFIGDYMSYPVQASKSQLEPQVLEHKLYGNEWVDFIVEKKDGTKIGFIAHFETHGKLKAIGYALLPSERKKGYGGEAIRIMVDYLFLSKDIVRIQAETHPQNIASQKALEKAGFSKEGIIRQSFFSRGVWRDTALFSILRQEWKQPKIIGQ